MTFRSRLTLSRGAAPALFLLAAGALAVLPAAWTQAPDPSGLLDQAEAALVLKPQESRELASTVLQQLGPGGERSLRLRALSLKATADLSLLLAEEALALADEGLAMARPSDPVQVRARLLEVRGWSLGSLGKNEEALKVLDEAVATARGSAAQEPVLMGEILVARGTRLADAWRHDESLRDLTEAVRLLEAQRDRPRLAEAYASLAMLYELMDADGPALDYGKRAAAIFEAEGGIEPLAAVTFNTARVLQSMKDYEAAYGAYARSMELSRRCGDEAGVAYALHGMGVVRGRQGRTGEGLSHLRAARPVFERLGDRPMVFSSLVEQGRLERAAGFPQSALKSLERAMTLAPGGDAEGGHDRAIVHLEMAQTLADLKRWREAYDHQKAASDLQLSLDNETLRRQTQELRARFDSERMEAENALLAKGRELADFRTTREVSRRRMWGVIAALAVFLAGLFALGLLRDRKIRKRLEELASTDDLTRLPNRRTIFAAAAAEFDRSRRYGIPLALAVLDLDGFKAVNDEYGHAAGDEVLRGVSAFLQEQLRSPDQVGRMGGEEFLALFPHTGAEGATAAAGRLCDGLREKVFPVFRGQRRITLSVGVTQSDPGDGDLDAVLRRADVALYEAKRSGRDRVITLSAPDPALGLAGAVSRPGTP